MELGNMITQPNTRALAEDCTEIYSNTGLWQDPPSIGKIGQRWKLVGRTCGSCVMINRNYRMKFLCSRKRRSTYWSGTRPSSRPSWGPGGTWLKMRPRSRWTWVCSRGDRRKSQWCPAGKAGLGRGFRWRLGKKAMSRCNPNLMSTELVAVQWRN